MNDETNKADWLDKYEKTKEYKDSIKEFNRKLYFNTRFRNNLRRDSLKLQKDSLDYLDKIYKFDMNDIQTRKTLVLWDSITDLSGEYLKSCDRAENYAKTLKIKNGKFEVHKKTKGKAVIFKSFFYKNIEKRNKIAYLFLPSGLTKRKSSGQIVRKRMSLGKYDIFDKGKFSQIHKNFGYIRLIFRGRKTYAIKVTQRGKIKDNIWAELIS